MSLIQRKPRPLTRDRASLRDDRLFIVACDDTYAPKQYFDFFTLPRVKVTVLPARDTRSGAGHVLESLLQYEHESGDERWMLLDTDHYVQGSHLGSFLSAIRTAEQKGVRVALSKPCFEVWLLLHHQDEFSIPKASDCGVVEDALRSKLGGYNKTNLKFDHFPPATVGAAIGRARKLDQDDSMIPKATTTRVYQLWESIIDKVPSWQLPPGLAR